MKKAITLIILISVSIFLVLSFVYQGIHFYNKQKFEILKNEDNQVTTLKEIYIDFFDEFKVDDSGNILLDKTCLTNIITNSEFNDNNIKKLKELEKNNVENGVIHTLYLEYNKDNSILILTLKEENGIQEYRKRYKLYVKEDAIKYETYVLVQTMYMTPSK